MNKGPGLEGWAQDRYNREGPPRRDPSWETRGVRRGQPSAGGGGRRYGSAGQKSQPVSTPTPTTPAPVQLPVHHQAPTVLPRASSPGCRVSSQIVLRYCLLALGSFRESRRVWAGLGRGSRKAHVVKNLPPTSGLVLALGF